MKQETTQIFRIPVTVTAAFLACLFLVFPAHAAENPSGAGLSGGTQDIAFTIRFFDRRIYYAETEPVYIQVTITNNSPSPFRFKLADERAFSVDFEVRTMNNRPLEPSASLVRRRTQSGRVFFREISVESRESFSFVEDLRDYARLDSPGSFVVRAKVYPELYPLTERPAAGADGEGLQSNRLTLNLRPPSVPGPGGIPAAMDGETGAVLVRKKMPPDEVVEYFIQARQKSQWEKYFLYLDIDSLLSRDPARRRRWLAEGEEGRRRMAEAYRAEVQAGGEDIAVLPTEYTIERTEYGALEGTVTALEKFRYVNFTERKRYTYYLRLADDIWTIVDYSVVNLGTE